METIVLCNDDIAYTSDPIGMCKKSLKSINLQILVLVLDPNPTEEKEEMRNELCHKAHCLEVRDNESLARTIVQ